jgi:DNA repair exonuclease SbcCD ATPase subunit
MEAEDKRKADAERQDKRRQRLAAVGIRPMTAQFPEADRPLVRDLSHRVLDGQPIRQAMRALGGMNEPEPGEASAELSSELEAARNRIAEVEREAEKRLAEIEAAKAREGILLAERDAARTAEADVERQRQALEAELNATKATAVAERGKARAKAIDAQAATKDAEAARKQVMEVLDRAGAAEGVIRQVRNLPGLKGRLVRWLAGDVLEQRADGDKGADAKFP